MKYRKASDVYSFAYVIYEIMMNELPFNECISPKDIKHNIIEGKRPKFMTPISMIYRKHIERFWSTEPKS